MRFIMAEAVSAPPADGSGKSEKGSQAEKVDKVREISDTRPAKIRRSRLRGTACVTSLSDKNLKHRSLSPYQVLVWRPQRATSDYCCSLQKNLLWTCYF